MYRDRQGGDAREQHVGANQARFSASRAYSQSRFPFESRSGACRDRA
jgi:hypothetical protein